MKKIFGFVAVFMIGLLAIAQPTPHEKAIVRNDLARERDKRHDVARDIFHGQPEKARADHRAAVVYHKQAVRHTKQIHRRHRVRHHARVVRRHHYVHHRARRPHTTVIIRH